MTDVFISYSRKDIAFARLLHKALEEGGLETWIDWQDIPPSADWLAEVYEAIESADTFIFVISETSVISEVCQLEITHAEKNNKRLIPIVVSEVETGAVHPTLSALNWIFFKEGEAFHSAVQLLIEAIQTDQAWVKQHTRLQVRALEWERSEGEKGFLLRGQDLAQAETWLSDESSKDPQPTALHTRYILTSRQDAARRQRLTIFGVSVGLVFAVGLGILAWTQRNVAIAEGYARATAQHEAVAEANMRATAESEAVAESHMRATAQIEAEIASTQAVQQKEEAERQAALARAGLFSVEALSHLDDNLSLSLLLGVEALSQADTIQSRASLLTALTYNPSAIRDYYGHQGPVSNAAFSPGGEMMVTAGCSLPGPSRGNMTCEQGEILFWSVESGELLDVVITPHPVFISDLVFSPDGSYLVSSDWNGTIVVWDVASRRPAGDPLFENFGRVLDLVFSPNGDYFISSHELLTTGSGNMISGELRVWDPETLELIEHIPLVFTLPYANLIITPDGKTMVTAQQSSTSVSLWDLEKWERVPDAFEGYQDVARSMDISPDGRTLVFGNHDSSLLLWDLAAREPIGEKMTGHTDLINKVAFSPDGKQIISVGEDQTIRLWDSATREPIADPFATLTEALTDAAFHPSNGSFVTTGQEGSVRLWYPTSHTAIEQVLPGSGEAIWDAAFSPEGRTVSGASTDGTISIWDLASEPALSDTLDVDQGQIYSLDFNPNGSLLALGGQPGVQIWDWRAGIPVAAMLEGREQPVVCVDFSPDGTLLASGGMDSKIVLWDGNTGEMIIDPLSGHHATVNDLAFSPSGAFLASVGCSSSDPQYCVQGELIIWNLGGTEIVSETRIIHGHNVWTLAFSPDGATIATGSGDETIQLWDVASGEALGEPILGHEIGVTSLAFSPDGAVLASGGIDTTILLTDLGGRQRISPPLTSPGGPVTSLVFSPDGRTLASTSQDGNLTLWALDLQVWIDKACRRAGRNLTQAEWDTYLPGENYHPTCPEYE